MKFARRLDKVPPYLFVEISRKIAEKRAQGLKVISFGIGDPDISTPANVVERLRVAALDEVNHRYPETDGLPEFRRAVSDWYKRRFDVELDPDTEVMPLIGAKEGIGHAALSFVDPGDVVLVPNPGYPVYSVGTWFAGGDCHWMPLCAEKGWLADVETIPPNVATKAKLMWLNYPNNPTGAVADLSYFEKIVQFSQANDIAVMHDASYSEVAFDDFEPVSYLAAAGAKERGLEFHSLSKSYNMTGWRIGVAAGNAEMIEALMVVKSNLDSGIPNAIQYMGIEALNSSQALIGGRNAVYQARRDRVVETLRGLGMRVDSPKASLYVWARVPDGYTSTEFATRLLDEKNVVVTAGNGYGSHGEGYFRLSLTISEEDLVEGLARLASWDIPRH